MKQIYIAIVCILFYSTASFAEPCYQFGIKGGIVGNRLGEDISCDWSSAPIGWNGEHLTGNLYACKADNTSILGALTNGTIVGDPGSLYGNVFLYDANNEYLTIGSLTNAEVRSSEGYAKLHVRTGDISGNTYIFGYIVDSSNKIEIYLRSDEKPSLVHTGNGTAVSVGGASATALTIDAWTYIYVAWKTNGSLHGQAAGVELGIKVGSGSWVYGSVDAKNFVSEGTSIMLGYTGSQNHGTVYIDSVEIWSNSTGSGE